MVNNKLLYDMLLRMEFLVLLVVNLSFLVHLLKIHPCHNAQ